ncbi:response regulator [Thermodesulfovibrio sp. 3907-1M]|uniref:Response regulator n=1 Tax=Thermodesulfovibrio autotrophicus TaxID=3118333 RepID=A0AAU8GUU0_9BACT
MNRGRILIIDDRQDDLSLTKELLEKVGYNVVENLGWLGSTKTIKNFKPDLVLLDVNMPALSGERLYELLEKNLKTEGIPVLFYSSMDENFLKRLALQKRVDYIPKGDVFQLYKKISFYIKKSY